MDDPCASRSQLRRQEANAMTISARLAQMLCEGLRLGTHNHYAKLSGEFHHPVESARQFRRRRYHFASHSGKCS
jgi:hypothetical protein